MVLILLQFAIQRWICNFWLFSAQIQSRASAWPPMLTANNIIYHFIYIYVERILWLWMLLSAYRLLHKLQMLKVYFGIFGMAWTARTVEQPNDGKYGRNQSHDVWKATQILATKSPLMTVVITAKFKQFSLHTKNNTNWFASHTHTHLYSVTFCKYSKKISLL